MSKLKKEIEGSISKELKEVPAFLSERLGIKADKSPQSVYNMCKREGLYIELDFPNDHFKIQYFVEKKAEAPVEEETTSRPEDPGTNIGGDITNDDDFDFLDEG